MANQKYSKRPYFGLLKWLLIILIIGRILGLIILSSSLNKEMSSIDKEIMVDYLFSRSYKITMIFTALLDIALFSFILWFITR